MYYIIVATASRMPLAATGLPSSSVVGARHVILRIQVGSEEVFIDPTALQFPGPYYGYLVEYLS
jgi:hypothetical protein